MSIHILGEKTSRSSSTKICKVGHRCNETSAYNGQGGLLGLQAQHWQARARLQAEPRQGSHAHCFDFNISKHYRGNLYHHSFITKQSARIFVPVSGSLPFIFCSALLYKFRFSNLRITMCIVIHQMVDQKKIANKLYIWYKRYTSDSNARKKYFTTNNYDIYLT